MKKLLLISMGMLLSLAVRSQTIDITDSRVVEDDGVVWVCFTANIKNLKSNYKLTVTPVLYNADDPSNDLEPIVKDLEPIVLVGRNRSITERRMGNQNYKLSVNENVIEYLTTVPYESWMAVVSLKVKTQTESCCQQSEVELAEVMKPRLIHYIPDVDDIAPIEQDLTPVRKFDKESQFLYPMEDYKAVKDSFDVMRAEGALIVRFNIGEGNIDNNFGENESSLRQIDKVMALIENDPQAELGKIVLAGASSPDGSLKRNKELSEQRAASLRKYLGSSYASRNDLFEVISIGEDWVGLRKMVESSDMKYKQEVLDIINTVPVEKGRETELMKLKGGVPYKYMMKHMFPKLRSAGYIRIFYESQPTEEFLATNSAIDRYNGRDYQAALDGLEGAKSTATTQEIRGVCHMMLGDYDMAEKVLNEATELGSKNAPRYKEQLSKMREVQQNRENRNIN